MTHRTIVSQKIEVPTMTVESNETKEEAVFSFLAGELGVDTASVGRTTPMFSTGIIDSFALVSLITFIEKRYAVAIAPGEVTLENLDTVERILQFLQRKANGRVTGA